MVAADVDMPAADVGDMAGKDAEAPIVEVSVAAAAEADGPEGSSLGTAPVGVSAVAEVVAEAEAVALVAVMVPAVAVAAAVALASAGVEMRCLDGLSKAPSSDCRAREWSKKMLQGSAGEQEPVGGDGVVASG